MTRFLRQIVPAATCVVTLVAGAREAHGQSGQAHAVARVPVTVVLEAGSSGPPAYRIARRAHATPHELLLIHGDPDPVTFSDAVRSLLALRVAIGDSVTTTAPLRVTHAAGDSVSPYPWASRVLRDLRAASPRSIAGIGRARAIEIWLPPQRHIR